MWSKSMGQGVANTKRTIGVDWDWNFIDNCTIKIL
jgi:hypothetical protein